MMYLEEKTLHVEKFGSGIAWLDTGSHESLLAASSYVKIVEERQGLKLGCPEEIAWRNGWVSQFVSRVSQIACPPFLLPFSTHQ